MRALLVGIIVFVSIPIIIRNAHVGVLVWSWLGYMNPHRLTYGWAYNFPFSMLVALVFFISFCLSKEKKNLPLSWVLYVWMGFLFWQIITTIFAVYPGEAWYGLKQTLKIQVILVFGMTLLNTQKRIEQWIWVIVVSIGYYGVKGGVFTILTGGQYRVWGPPSSFIEDNNQLALALLMIIPLARYLQLTIKNKWGSYVMLASIVLMVVSSLGSHSRGAFLALISMLLVMTIKSSKKLPIIIGLLLFLPLAILSMPDSWLGRMESIRDYEEDDSANMRINGYLFAINLAKDRPLVGKGYGPSTKELYLQYAPIPDYPQDVHSVYFEILAEHGFVGLTLFIFIGIGGFRTASWIIKATKDRTDLKWANELARMITVSLVGYSVGGTFLALGYYDLPYNLIAILLLIRMIVVESLNQEEVIEKEPMEQRETSFIKPVKRKLTSQTGHL